MTSATDLAAIQVSPGVVGWLLMDIGDVLECSFCAKAGASREPRSWAIVRHLGGSSLQKPGLER
jgi:hypothetical protein